MIKTSILDGVVRRAEPAEPHSPLGVQNRVLLDVFGPNEDGNVVCKQSVVHEGNILLTYGLNRLVEMLASDAGGGSAWMNYIGLGSATQAANSTYSGILSTFGTGTVGGATHSRSDKGARTAEFQATFSDTDNPRSIQEVALCQTNTYDASGGARSVLGTDSVVKASGDTVNISYQFIAGTG